MTKVAITGWKKGCNTVAAIKEIREKAPMPLNEALDVVNRVLRDEQVIVPVSTSSAAQALADALGEMGLIARTVGETLREGRLGTVSKDA
jgi:hypothetical protein